MMLSYLSYTLLLKHIRTNMTGYVSPFGASYTTFCKNIQTDLTTSSSHYSYLSKTTLVPFSKEQENEFLNYFPKVLKALVHNTKCPDMEDVSQKLTTLLKYNLPNGEKIRGITTVASYVMLEKSYNLTKENVELANMLGWCAELLDRSIIIAEDIIENREARGDVLCWFRLPGVETNAILDVSILEHCIYFLLKKNFSNNVFYVPVVELFHDIIYKEKVGQLLSSQKLEIDKMDMNMFNRITEYRNGYHTFYFSVTLGMYLSKVYKEELHKQVGPVLLEMGKYYQIWSYMQNCYVDSKLTGNADADIGGGKCTWLLASTLQKANISQKEIIKRCYGKQEEKSIKEIRKLYESLNLPGEFEVYKEKSFETVRCKTENITNISIRCLLNSLVKHLYGCLTEAYKPFI